MNSKRFCSVFLWFTLCKDLTFYLRAKRHRSSDSIHSFPAAPRIYTQRLLHVAIKLPHFMKCVYLFDNKPLFLLIKTQRLFVCKCQHVSWKNSRCGSVSGQRLCGTNLITSNSKCPVKVFLLCLRLRREATRWAPQARPETQRSARITGIISA